MASPTLQQAVPEWTRKHALLSQQEKNYHLSHQDVPSLVADAKKLCEQAQHDHSDRQRTRESMFQQVAHTRALVHDLQDQLCADASSSSLVEEVAALVQQIEAALGGLQDAQQQQYAALVQEELHLTHELDAFLASAADFLQPGPGPAAAMPKREQPQLQRHGGRQAGLEPEVEECDAYVAAHGPTGGWDEDAHRDFLQVLKSCGGDYGHAVLVASEQMVGVSREALIQHARWHQVQDDLQLRKRLAVAEWRARKEVAAEAHAELQELQDQQRAQEEQVLQAQWRRQADRAEQKSQVAAWRAQREEAARQQQEQQRQLRHSDLQRQDQQRRARQAANRDKLDAYRTSKLQQQWQQAEQHAERQASATGSRRPSQAGDDAGAQERLQRRNRELLGRLQQLREARQQPLRRREEVQQQIRQQVCVEAERDPLRLLQPTTAFRRRLEAGQQEGAGGAEPLRPGWVLHIERRSTPSWLRS